jgi:zinc transport system substrate-binding protein
MMRVAVLTFGLMLVVSGCTRPGAPTDRLPVVATFYPLFEFAQRAGGDRVAVRVLVPAGVEPHDFEPTPQDVAALTNARVVIYNGAGFEPWLEKLLSEAPATAVKVNTARELPLYRGRDGGVDPHVWLDPVLAARQVGSIMRGLSSADPEGRAAYEANGRSVVDDLNALNTRFESTLSTCRRRTFITSHAAFGYLARRYGLIQVSISGLSPEAEPSPARLKEIVQEARRSGTQVIYYETLVSPRVAEVIAREVGARVAVLDPLEGLTADEQREGRNYFTVMDENLRALADGLDCR